MQRFAGRNMIVTGASRGIGAALAQRLAAEGANLLLVARTVDKHDHLAGSLTETVDICKQYGTTVVALAADLADPASRAAIVPKALEVFDGRVDVLISNAAAAIYMPTTQYPYKRQRIMFEVNVHAPIELAQAVIPTMERQGEGWIINVSSGSARHADGPPFRTHGVATTIGVYGSTKAALNRITNAFAVELYGKGIRINTVEPRAGVMSEGAEALVGGIIREDQIESMEAMVEGAIYLCDCPPEHTGRVDISLDLLDAHGITVMTLDGRAPYPGGQRVYRG